MRKTILAVAVAAAVLFSGQASAHSVEQVTVPAAGLHPEGVAWDPTRAALLVSSATRGSVSVVTPRGVRTLASDPRMISTFGITVDAKRGRLLVAYADLGVSPRSTPDTIRKVGGLGIFDLRSGRASHVVRFGLAPNDVTVDPAGNAYVSDPAGDTVWKVDVNGNASAYATDARFAAADVGLNGIVWHPQGFLLGVNYTTGALLKIKDGAVSEVTLDRPLVGGDGLAVQKDGTVISVTNTLLAPGADAVRTIVGDRGFRSGRSIKYRTWSVAGPSTVAVTPRGARVLSGRLEVLVAGGTSPDFVLKRY
jgi:DNA-binding beta-propeller fold protein YncE